MNEIVKVTELRITGLNGESLILITDFSTKSVSLVEVNPKNVGNPIRILEVQDYTKRG